MQLDAKIRAMRRIWVQDFFGVADLAPAHDFISCRRRINLAQYPKAISIGIALLNTIVEHFPWKGEKALADGNISTRLRHGKQSPGHHRPAPQQFTCSARVTGHFPFLPRSALWSNMRVAAYSS